MSLTVRHGLMLGTWWKISAREFSTVRQETLAAKVAKYAAKRPNPVNIQSWMSEFGQPKQLAEFLCHEMPIRYAERIRCIETISEWRHVEELAAVHDIQLNAFETFSQQQRTQWEDASQFKAMVEDVQLEDRRTKFLLMQAAQKLRAQRQSDSFTDPFSLELNKFLDDFLLSRLGCNMLMGQYLACTTSRSSIVNPQCDAFEICQKAADEVKRRCRNSQGRVPLLNVRAFTMSGQMATEGHVPRFSYIPGILMHVVRELLKNSCQASLELAKSEAELEDMPIDVIVCADKQHVVIRITDCARGIPRHVGSKIWSYLYSGSPTAMTGLSFGYGIGSCFYCGRLLSFFGVKGFEFRNPVTQIPFFPLMAAWDVAA
ncbi:unnamed protein product [Durusdinium trenchii]|uniref:Protein-serine/threonine kinase n=1 Tax=Durusdinium trenchii TaxID=1381693 RepID=A0ABP0SZ90_9DINO